MSTPPKAIWLLRPRPGVTGPSLVVRAICEQCSRTAAVAQAGAEGTTYWRDPEQTSVVRVTETGITGTVLRREAID